MGMGTTVLAYDGIPDTDRAARECESREHKSRCRNEDERGPQNFDPLVPSSASPYAVPSCFMPRDRFDLAARSARLQRYGAGRTETATPFGDEPGKRWKRTREQAGCNLGKHRVP
jgi:hypothetical protein